MSLVLLLCPDVITIKMAGPAIRYWEFANALSQQHTVTLAIPNPIDDLLPSLPSVRLVQHRPDNIAELIAWAELIIFQGHILKQYPLVKHSAKVLIADLYDPIPLEGLEQHRQPTANAQQVIAEQVHTINEQLQWADYFLCANDRQRDLWMGHLLALGRINPHTYPDIQQRVLTIPFGLPDQPPQRKGPGLQTRLGKKPSFILLWGGGIWQWFDPLTLIKAVHQLAPRYPGLALVFLGTQHPNSSIQPMAMQYQAQALAQQLGVLDQQVYFLDGWIPYEELGSCLLEAQVGVSAHADCLETHYSFRTRLLYYLWAGKPILTTQGDVLAAAIEHYQAGLALPPQDVQAWVHAIEKMQDPDYYDHCVTGVRNLALAYRWSVVTAPLQTLCQQAVPAPDILIEGKYRKIALWDCEQAYKELRYQLDWIERSHSWRITAPLRNFRRWVGALLRKHHTPKPPSSNVPD